MLKAEEEYLLAARWRERRDRSAVLTSHLRLVAKIAMGYRRYGVPISDSISEGNIGTMLAVKRFDPVKGMRFSTYANWWIKAAIRNCILRSWAPVKLGNQKRRFFNLSKVPGVNTWFDHVLRRGILFLYAEDRSSGLLEGKRAVIIRTRSHAAHHGAAQAIDAQEFHLRTMLELIGITDVTFLGAGMAASTQDAREQAIAAALVPLAGADAPDRPASNPSARRAGHLHGSERPRLTGHAAEKAHHSWPPARLMQGALRTLARLSQVAALVGLGLVPAQSAPLNQFDGRWSILVVTDRGDCSIYRYGVIVDHGRARYAGTADFTIDGSIAPNGTVRARISRGSNHADVRGRVGQGTGSGLWHTAGSYDCSGHWTAEHRAGSEEG
jgi:RNA polymerase sigma factor (sigma-70 family)